MGPSSRAHYWYRQAEREVEQLRDEYGDRSDIHLGTTGRPTASSLRPNGPPTDPAEQRQTLDALKQRRATATDALLIAGVCGDEAERMLDGIDRDTTLAPPF